MNDRNTAPDPMPDDHLEALLARAAAAPPTPLPEQVRARLLSDALAQMPPPVRPRRPSAVTRFLQSLGGAPGIAGLTAAGVAGLWIGVAPPQPVAGLSGAFWQGAALVNPDLAAWGEDAPEGFDDDPLLALLTDD